MYYSGHGIEAGGENYLVPVDADFDFLDSAEESFASLSQLLEALRSKAKIVIVLLDACRTSPFPTGARLRTRPRVEATPIGSIGLVATKGVVAFDDAAGAAESLGAVVGFAAAPRHRTGGRSSASPRARLTTRMLTFICASKMGGYGLSERMVHG